MSYGSDWWSGEESGASNRSSGGAELLPPGGLPWLNAPGGTDAPPAPTSTPTPTPAPTPTPTPPSAPLPTPHAPTPQAPGRPHPAGPALSIRDVTVVLPSGAVVLDGVSFDVGPGQLIAVVGPTGAGKSTLVRAMTGQLAPTTGSVCVLGGDLYDHLELLRPRIGAVPQDDIVDRSLTVRQALGYGAELRLPPDATAEQRQHAVEDIIGRLGLSACADLPISSLSGGQRKRTSVALELLGDTAVLVLDEPTSGLDPGFEQSVMDLLRHLADSGKGVVVVTHSVASLDRCDQVVFLAPGGRLAYAGRPADALAAFGVPDLPSLFHQLDQGPRGRRVDPSTVPQRPPRDAPPPAPVRWRQVSTLARRHAAAVRADRRNLTFLVAAPAVLAALVLAVVGPGALGRASGRDGSDPRILIGSLVVAACALGAANGVREIVREEALYRRERALGVSRHVYLLAKLVVMGSVTVAQCLLMVAITVVPAGAPFMGRVLPTIVEIALAVSLSGIVALCIGLAVSAVVSSSEKALTVVPVIFVVSYLFSGASVDLESHPVLKMLSFFSPSGWGVAAAASSVDLPRMDHCRGGGGCDARWSPELASWIVSLGGAVVLGIIALVLAEVALARKEPLPELRRDVLVVRGARWMAARLGGAGSSAAQP